MAPFWGAIHYRKTSAIGDRHIIALLGPSIELAWTANALGRIRDHFIPLCNPAYRAGACKENGEHVSWETNRRQDHAALEICIGIELPFDEIYLVESDMYQFLSYIKHGVADPQPATH